jgi:hypothetical protein
LRAVWPYGTALFTLMFSQPIKQDDSWVTVGELTSNRKKHISVPLENSFGRAQFGW